MATCAATAALSHAVLDNILQMHILPNTGGISGINLCTQFISYWDCAFKLRELNDSLFYEGMTDHENGKKGAVDRFILDYMPDLEDLGVWDDMRDIAKDGGRLAIPNYCFNGYNLNGDVRCTVLVAKLDDYVVITGEHVVHGDALSECPRTYDFLCEQDKLNRTIDVLVKRLENVKLAQAQTVRANLESELIPLCDMLEASPLDERQKMAVSTIRECLESIADDYDARLTSPEIGLSFREREVAALAHRGKTAVEIACILGISKRTVEAHKANIARKIREAAK